MYDEAMDAIVKNIIQTSPGGLVYASDMKFDRLGIVNSKIFKPFIYMHISNYQYFSAHPMKISFYHLQNTKWITWHVFLVSLPQSNIEWKFYDRFEMSFLFSLN